MCSRPFHHRRPRPSVRSQSRRHQTQSLSKSLSPSRKQHHWHLSLVIFPFLSTDETYFEEREKRMSTIHTNHIATSEFTRMVEELLGGVSKTFISQRQLYDQIDLGRGGSKNEPSQLDFESDQTLKSDQTTRTTPHRRPPLHLRRLRPRRHHPQNRPQYRKPSTSRPC